MTQWIRRRQGWLIPIVVAVLALTVGMASGGAIASTQAAPADYCADLYPAASTEYERCRFWDDPSLEGITSIDGQAPASNAAYVTPQPVTFCAAETPPVKKTSGKTMISATSCSRPIACTWNTSTGKYHCKDASGTPVNPPGRICAENPNYACAATPQAPDNPAVALTPTRQPVPTVQAHPTQNAQALQQPAAPTANPALPGTGQQAPTPTASMSTSPAPVSPPSTGTAADPNDPAAQAIQQAQALGLHIWLETDLVAIWQAGADQLKAAAARLAQQANQPNVLGVKFATDLGLRGGFTDPAEVRRFVAETSAALRAVLPPGRRLAVDVVVSELGCGQNRQCVDAMHASFPLLKLAEVERYVLTGAVDAVNVTTPLFNPFLDIYKQAGLSADRVLQQQWMALRIRSWDSRVPGLYIGARELGLAHPDNKPALTGPAAETAVKARLDGPLRLGVQHVVLWTWRQNWSGTAWRLNDAGLRANDVWDALRSRKALRRTSIVFNPRETERSVAEDLREIANIASTVYITTQ
ncbi:hypothetical protein ACFV1N_46120 [Streptosporangium canum]|uniref:hypothetical protein n=1 Tax=Streptosporangium canum TaxID=324952 RepID=UPI00367B6341